MNSQSAIISSPRASLESTGPHDRLSDSFAFCRDVTRLRARNFYYGLRFTPRAKRDAMYALYAWSRRADDLVDQAREVSRARAALDALRRSTILAAEGKTDDPDDRLNDRANCLPAVAHTIARFSIPIEYFLDLLDRQIEDLTVSTRQDFESLRSYCYGVASTVGLMCITVWGYRSEAARELAIKRGIAMQLTNILRDYVEDHDRGRVYLPQEDFARFELTPRDLRDWRKHAHCEQMMRFQIERAKEYFSQSRALESMLDPGCARASWIMAEIYRSILGRIARRPHCIAHRESLRLSMAQKSAIVLRAFAPGKWAVE